ncbi:MAG: UPF0175 family protein [Nitrospinae bacterium]|nr:UPF0175 family protein [Nitrospinota bacterium]MBI5427519.1 UPF0175 family protein [Nitrospinota bacterium]
MKITIDLPDTENLSKIGPSYLKEALTATLYHHGDISEKEACLILEKNRREFEELLPRFGFSVLSDNQENIEVERNA